MSEEQLFQSIQSFDQQEAKQLFGVYIENIDSILDHQNASILHVAANYNNQEAMKYFLEQYDNYSIRDALKYSTQRKIIWLNRKDNEGFTAVHYAVFRGNIDLAILLEQHGADIYSINKQGLTVIHIAAQGDSPVLMYYYLNKGMKISSEDSKGSTALHWACYSGQENSAYALLAWGAEMDKQDFTYGMTPLHLAVMSGNGRIVKKLLMRGCDRNIKNYNGKLPLDLAIQNQYKNITEMIIDKQGFQELFNVKSPFRKIGKVTFPFYFLLTLYLTNYILNLSFVLFQHFPQKGDLAFAYLALGLLIGILFTVVTKKQPGFICIQQTQNDYQMLKHNHPSKVCFDCMLLNPERSRHCQICGRCVSVYDHHCPWVTNCIGSQNYIWFYFFLVSMQTFMIFTVIFQSISNILQQSTGMTIQFWKQQGQFAQYTAFYAAAYSSFLFHIYSSYKPGIAYQTRQLSNVMDSNPNATTLHELHSYPNLKEHLLLKRNSNASQEDMKEDRSVTTRIQAASELSPFYNCYLMCVGNANNIVYQVGRIS